MEEQDCEQAAQKDRPMIEPSERAVRRIKRAALVILLLSVLPFLILTLFSQPAYDDYGFAITTIKRGFLTAQKAWYFSITGKYFSIAVLSLGPLTFGSFVGYKVVASIIILLTFGSIFSLITALFEGGAELTDRLLLTGLIAALFSNQMPDVTEAYYWMTGAVIYQLASALTLFLMAFMIRSLKRPRVSVGFLFCCGSLLIFAIVGSSETSMAILLLLVFTITLRAFSIRSQYRRLWLALFVVSVLCSLIVVAAPGNAVRSSYAPERGQLFFSLRMSFFSGTGFLVSWLTDPAFILSTLLFIPAAGRFSSKSALFKNHLYIHPVGSLFLLLFIVFLGFFLPYWATGMLYQHRTVNTVFFFFLVGWFINLTVWVIYMSEKWQTRVDPLPAYVYLICLPIIALTLLFSNNTRIAMTDLFTGRAYYYDREVRKRRSLIKQCALDRRSDCHAQQLVDLPETTTNAYFETELSAEQQYWETIAASSTAKN